MSSSYYSGGYYHSSRIHNKTYWAGISIADAYKSNLDYQTKLLAQKKLHEKTKSAQKQIRALTETEFDAEYLNQVKMQLAPFYTNYPSIVAAHAAIGLTCFLQYREIIENRMLELQLGSLQDDLIQGYEYPVNLTSFEKLVLSVTKSVQTRLILEELDRSKISSVDIYRLFIASQCDLQFLYMDDIINAVILFGDVFPCWKELDLHPTTRAIFENIQPVSKEFTEGLAKTDTSGFLLHGREWIFAVCEKLMQFLPPPDEEDEDDYIDSLEAGGYEMYPKSLENWDSMPEKRDKELKDLVENIPPMNKKQPPSLYNQEDLAAFVQKNLAERILQGGQDDPNQFNFRDRPIMNTIMSLAQTLAEASGQQSQWEDMRADLVEKALRRDVFNPGPIEGTPSDGHEVTVDLGNNEKAMGEVFDRPLEISDDISAHEELLSEAEPLIREMRKVLYPNTVIVPEKEKFCSSGSLDGARLPQAEFTSGIFKRYHHKEIVDKGGKPVLLIACDASGSLNPAQIKLLKILSAAWIHSTLKTDIQVISGIYHSGEVRKGLNSPLVQWIYHPRKTPAVNVKEASRAIVSLPEAGTGCQADSLSLAFMVEKAEELAKGRMIYLILLSDCVWNQSFHTDKSGEEEMICLFDGFREKYKDRLDTTLIALGVNDRQRVFDQINKVIMIGQKELDAPVSVAEKINLYVAKCLKERKHNLRK